ncbi:coiled-coil domain-containing protein 13-like [Colletes gigas]|uniref:coiled-coil domain-containing protein 13-like n=1 Tax=Colletes gigas TaxID=935657 RepID=UPI001C9BA7B9|nr:coiled-coil domain-containing protein 13-like [Colletes gigas]
MSKSEVKCAITQDETNDSLDFGAIISWTNQSTEEELPDHIIFPKELNLFLRNRIQDLIAENGCLRRALEEAEEKITKKQVIAETVQTKTIIGKSNEVVATKIIELSKRCREQTAEIEVLKSKCKNLEINLVTKETELKNEDSILDKGTENSQSKEDEHRTKHLIDKLQQTQTKLYESKNTCVSLKQEINKLHKLLCSEVGENLNINNLLNQPNGWRGRAEQIHLLQQKVTELQSKLWDYEGTQKTIASVDRKNLTNLRNLEKERRQQIENSAKQLRQSEIAIEGYKRKIEASKARIKVLEHELNLMKGNLSVLNEKRTHDDHLIETLSNRLKTMEMKHQEREMDIKSKEETNERHFTNLKNDLQSAQLQIDRLRRRLEEREIEIDKLRGGTASSIGPFKAIQMDNYLNSLNHASPPHSFRNLLEPNEYVTLALAAEAERERLLELVTVLNRRLDKERSDSDILSNSLRDERSKSAKLESKLRKLETERASIVRIDTGYRSRLLPRSLKANDEFIDAEQARLKMELLQEECLALKARLDIVQQDKASDLAAYKQMLSQVRKIFQEAYRGKPPPTVGSRSTITM